MRLRDVLDAAHRAALDSWLERLRADGRELQAVALNHDHEGRVPAGLATRYVERLQKLEDCPDEATCPKEECMHGACCAATDDMLCLGRQPVSPPTRLATFLTQLKLNEIMRDGEGPLLTSTLRRQGTYGTPDQCCRVANRRGIYYGQVVSERDGAQRSRVWATDATRVDRSWRADDLRDRLGVEWGRGHAIVGAHYPMSAARSCHIPTVVDAQGVPRFQPSDPALDYGMTRNGRDNAPELPEYVHRAILVGDTEEARFYVPLAEAERTTTGPSEDYLKAKLNAL